MISQMRNLTISRREQLTTLKLENNFGKWLKNHLADHEARLLFFSRDLSISLLALCGRVLMGMNKQKKSASTRAGPNFSEVSSSIF